jgi:arginyl-tRNA synthetase
MKEQLLALLEQAIAQLRSEGVVPAEPIPAFIVEHTKNRDHGNMASNVAMAHAKLAGMPPRELANRIIAAVPENRLLLRCEIAGPGFINFFFREDAASAVVTTILEQKDRYGCANHGQNRKVQVEFVSANPTGPLHVGHGRGAAIGDCLCRLLKATGWDVTREFYYNDAGAQISNLTFSTHARCKGIGPDHHSWPEDSYRGEYIIDVANAFLAKKTVEARDITVTANGDINDLEAIRHFAVAYLRHEQDQDLKAFDVDFDVYFLESSLYTSGQVEATVARLIENGKTYEHDGALWLKTTEFGDDKDRVMRKTEGGYTYFVPDIAYHHNKWNRGFTRVVNEQGADHHSTTTRVRAGLQALDAGIPQGWPEYVLHQMVMVMKGGEEVKLSKRAGSYVTLRDLIEEVGRDATRFFLASRHSGSQLTFDIDLAKSQSNDNPVYYIQYAHARVCSVERKLAETGTPFSLDSFNGALLVEEPEKAILDTLARYPETVAMSASRLEPHNIANYLKELAGQYHSYYNAHKVLVDDEALRTARVALGLAVKQVIANGLHLLGVSAPEQM